MVEHGRRLAASAVIGALTALGAPAVAGADVFTFTGAEQTFTVPAGVTSVRVEAIGGSGADGAATTGGEFGAGGRGARVRADMPVTPGQVLFVLVGGSATGAAGGFNGGGSTDAGSGGGGGASDVRTCSTTAPSCGTGMSSLASRLLVAGAGGGGGDDSQAGLANMFPGGDGGDAGEDGQWDPRLAPPFPTTACGPGQGATTSETGGIDGQNCHYGEAGGFGVGGDANLDENSGGGGGAGWLGGSGSAANEDDLAGNGGGGGSSYAVQGSRNVSVEIATTATTSVTITPLPPAGATGTTTVTTPGPTVYVPVPSGRPAAARPAALTLSCRRFRRIRRCTLTVRASTLGLPGTLSGATFTLWREGRIVARGPASISKGRVTIGGLRKLFGRHTLTIRTGSGRNARVRARRAFALR